MFEPCFCAGNRGHVRR